VPIQRDALLGGGGARREESPHRKRGQIGQGECRSPMPAVSRREKSRRWIRHYDLAARNAPEVVHRRCPLENRGRRESRVPSAPAVMRKNAHDGPQVRRNTRPSLRNGFNGLCRALPGDEFVLPPSLTDERSIEARSGLTISISLTPATGAGTTRFCRPQLPSQGAPTGLMCCRPKFPARAFKRRSSARLVIAHGIPPCDHLTRSTLPRPPQPVPTFVTTADAPLCGTGWREFTFDLPDGLSGKSATSVK
jgi:hypothetical protein